MWQPEEKTDDEIIDDLTNDLSAYQQENEKLKKRFEELEATPKKISKRERYLMKQAFDYGIQNEMGDYGTTVEEWLDEDIAEGGRTVEMLLNHNANKEKGKS